MDCVVAATGGAEAGVNAHSVGRLRFPIRHVVEDFFDQSIGAKAHHAIAITESAKSLGPSAIENDDAEAEALVRGVYFDPETSAVVHAEVHRLAIDSDDLFFQVAQGSPTLVKTARRLVSTACSCSVSWAIWIPSTTAARRAASTSSGPRIA